MIRISNYFFFSHLTKPLWEVKLLDKHSRTRWKITWQKFETLKRGRRRGVGLHSKKFFQQLNSLELYISLLNEKLTRLQFPLKIKKWTVFWCHVWFEKIHGVRGTTLSTNGWRNYWRFRKGRSWRRCFYNWNQRHWFGSLTQHFQLDQTLSGMCFLSVKCFYILKELVNFDL